MFSELLLQKGFRSFGGVTNVVGDQANWNCALVGVTNVVARVEPTSKIEMNTKNAFSNSLFPKRTGTEVSDIGTGKRLVDWESIRVTAGR